MKIGTLALPLFPILGFTLTILKALGVINISWFWVVAPFWMPVVAGFLVLAAIILVPLLIVGFCFVADYILEKK